MKKLIVALVAGFMSMAIAGAYAADDMKKDKKDSMSKSDKGASKGDSMSSDAMNKDDTKKKGKSKSKKGDK